MSFRQNAKSEQNRRAAAMGTNEKREVDWMINVLFGSFASAKNALITVPVFVFTAAALAVYAPCLNVFADFLQFSVVGGEGFWLLRGASLAYSTQPLLNGEGRYELRRRHLRQVVWMAAAPFSAFVSFPQMEIEQSEVFGLAFAAVEGGGGDWEQISQSDL